MKSITIILLVCGMLSTGTMNTLLTKLQDRQCIDRCDDPDPNSREYFEQPTWQTVNMFIGESLCLIVFYFLKFLQYSSTKNSDDPLEPVPPVDITDTDCDSEPLLKDHQVPLSGFANLLMWFPTCCDILGTTLMNIGLIYTSASIYQMLRGAVVIFSGILSLFFLGKSFRVDQWVSLLLIVTGVALVGLSPVLSSNTSTDLSKPSHALIGVFCVFSAQLFTACQFVIEEKILTKYQLKPVKAVGLEGIFGITTSLFIMLIVHLGIGQYQKQSVFNIFQGLNQILDNKGVFLTTIGICFSIAFFNWFGLSVTRTLSATSRSIIDTCRTFFIWMISLYLGWEKFQWLQVLGFALLIYGTFVFNSILRLPWPSG